MSLELGMLLETFYLSFSASSIEDLARDLRSIETFRNKLHSIDDKEIMEMVVINTLLNQSLTFLLL